MPKLAEFDQSVDPRLRMESFVFGHDQRCRSRAEKAPCASRTKDQSSEPSARGFLQEPLTETGCRAEGRASLACRAEWDRWKLQGQSFLRQPTIREKSGRGPWAVEEGFVA